MKTRIVIDLLAVEKRKAYGYREFIFNLLNYFYDNREQIKYSQVILVCRDIEKKIFEQYSDKFDIIGIGFSSLFKRLLIQNMLPIKMKLTINDLLISPGNYSGFIKRCPTILVIHDLLFKHKTWLKNTLMRWQREISVPISIKHADKVIAISDFTADEIRKWYPKWCNKVITIHNYFNFNKFQTKPVADEGDYFLVVSSDAYHKNLQTIIKAFNIYYSKGGTKSLTIVSKFIENSTTSFEFEKLDDNVKNRIKILQHITNYEMGFLYQRAACYISASLFEGLGMPIVEAMYFNLPVLLTKDDVFLEVSLGQGEYFDPNDEQELALKMQTIDCQKRNYSTQILEAYSVKNTSARYIDIINSFVC